VSVRARRVESREVGAFVCACVLFLRAWRRWDSLVVWHLNPFSSRHCFSHTCAGEEGRRRRVRASARERCDREGLRVRVRLRAWPRRGAGRITRLAVPAQPLQALGLRAWRQRRRAARGRVSAARTRGARERRSVCMCGAARRGAARALMRLPMALGDMNSFLPMAPRARAGAARQQRAERGRRGSAGLLGVWSTSEGVSQDPASSAGKNAPRAAPPSSAAPQLPQRTQRERRTHACAEPRAQPVSPPAAGVRPAAGVSPRLPSSGVSPAARRREAP
jgi:hypothetical protein